MFFYVCTHLKLIKITQSKFAYLQKNKIKQFENKCLFYKINFCAKLIKFQYDTRDWWCVPQYGMYIYDRIGDH